VLAGCGHAKVQAAAELPRGLRVLLNALASAIVFAVIFEVLVYYGYGRIEMSVSTTPEATAPVQ
jgi:hypothetical protein